MFEEDPLSLRVQSQRSIRRKNTLQRLLALVLAIYLFNFSIDPGDVGPIYKAEDLSVNDIESVAELLTEEVLGIEDLMKEIDEADATDKTLKPSVTFFLFPGTGAIKMASRTSAAILYPVAIVISPPALSAEVASPPPRRA